MKRVILNADDFGLSPGINDGVIAAHRQGALTSTSLLANGPAYEGAIRMAPQHPTLGIGIHLNLLRGQPLTPPSHLPHLVNATGSFLLRVGSLLPRLLSTRVVQAEAKGEMRAQIERVLAAGVKVSHLDSEKHLHLFPPLARVVVELAKEYGIGRMRLINEWGLLGLGRGRHGVRQLAKTMVLNVLSLPLRRRCTSLGVAVTDHSFGVLHTGHMGLAAYAQFLPRLRQGTTEILCHPGYPETPIPLAGNGGPGLEGWGPYHLHSHRWQELEPLLDRRLTDLFQQHGITLISYHHLPTPSPPGGTTHV